MPCCLLILILMSPRLALAVLYFFTRYLDRPFQNNLLLLILGFLFLPITTLVYAWMNHHSVPLDGINILWILMAVLLDLGMVRGGYKTQRTRS